MSIKIFLSTVSDEFLAYRDQLRSDLTRHNVEVKVQEDFKDYGGATLDKLDLYIGTCDAVIHLVGAMTGSAPSPRSVQDLVAKHRDIVEKLPPLAALLHQDYAISYTQWEAWLALYHGKVLLIAEADAAAPRGPKYEPSDASRAAQREHVQKLRGFERYSSTFTSPDNLAKIILSSAILDLLTTSEHTEASGALRSLPYSSLIAVLFLLVLTPLAADQLAKSLGISLAAPLVLAGAAIGLVLALMCWRYLGILSSGAEPHETLERRAYDGLRDSLRTGGRAVSLYSRWLSALFEAVDHFFGDAGMADGSLFPHAFGLRTPAPLWTAPAFDRCLLLALIYPIVTIFIMWAVTGHVGPAEQAMGIPPNLLAWQRGIILGVAGIAAFVIRRYVRAHGRKSLIWIALPLVVVCAAMAVRVRTGVLETMDLVVILIVFVLTAGCAFAVAGIVGAAVATWVPDRRARNVAFNVAGAVSIAFVVAFGLFGFFGHSNGFDGAIEAALAIASAFAGSGAVAVTLAVAIGVVPIVTLLRLGHDFGSFAFFALGGAVPVAAAFVIALIDGAAIKHRWQGIFLAALLAAMTLACLVSAFFLSSIASLSGPALLFLGLLTLLNAPFNWASLGLTRALLRRGLELKGWWPYLLALVDALCAGIIVTLLALTMVVGVQAFDELAISGGGSQVLALGTLFDGIATNSGEPQFWWVYALLLSTMIPSLVNLMLGGTALIRAVPGLGPLLLRYLPADRAVPAYDRVWIALVLTLQAAGGILVGVAAQALLAVGLIFYAMPGVGLGLLDLARAVAAFDLPGRILAIL